MMIDENIRIRNWSISQLFLIWNWVCHWKSMQNIYHEECPLYAIATSWATECCYREKFPWRRTSHDNLDIQALLKYKIKIFFSFWNTKYGSKQNNLGGRNSVFKLKHSETILGKKLNAQVQNWGMDEILVFGIFSQTQIGIIYFILFIHLMKMEGQKGRKKRH